MAEDNGLKNIVKKYSKRLTRVFIAASLLVIIIAIIFLGAVSTIYEEVSDAFKDVLDNVEINGDNLEINQDYLSEAEKRLQNMGIDASTLGLNGHEEYLERFLEAEVVTNYPYLGGDGLQGTVYFERAKIDGSTTELQYIAYDEFYAMQEAGNSEVYNYFTIDTEDWTVHVVKNSSQNSFEIEKINYKNMVEKFSMPFEFTIALAMTSQNPQFALAVVNLVKDSRIVITIAESKTTTTINKTETYHLERIIRDLETDEETVIEDDIETRAEPDISESYYTTVFLSRANTWILNQITDFSYEDTGDVDGEPQVEELEGGSETVTTETSEITSTISNRKSTTIVTTRQQRWNQGQPKVIEKTSNFTNLILRDTNTISGQGLIGVAKTCHDYLSDNGYTYGFGSGHREFPNIESISSIDCSAYVSWVLYKAGYEDIGAQSSSSLINYANEKGWEIINSVNDLKPGDIIIYTEHTNILVAIEGDKYLCYDCGDTSAVQAKDPIEYNVNNGFQYALRPNDEIVQALEPQNINDLKEDVKEYLDNISTGEYQVTVKNLDKSSRNSFSIGSGKVKSEGWLKLFIMATAYNEVKNGDIEETAVSSDIDRMITTDSNDAANALLTTLGDGDIEEGIDKVNAYLDRQNYNGTNLEEQFPIEVGSAGSDDNYTTIANVSKLLQNIYKNKCVNKEYSEKMMEMLKRQLLIEYIPSVITEGEVANKTGEQMNILQDAAIVSIENANYLLVVSATDVTDKAEAGRRIADISRMVNAYFVENGSVNDNSDNFAQDDELDIIMNGRRVCYNVPNIGYQCPLDNLVDAHEMLFELLGSLEKTQNHENLMRYLLYLLTGDSYGVEEFNFEEFVNGSFANTGGAWSVLWQGDYTKEEFIAAVEAYTPPNVTGNSGRSCVECYQRYFVANAENFFDICTRNGMDPRFIFCIGIHESYYGTSNIANEKGNFFGWGAYDWDPGGSAFEFADMSEGIEDVSSGLARNYVSPDGQWYQWIIDKGYDPTTVEGIGCRYASDDNWANAVKQHMTNIFGCTGGTSYNDGEATEMQAKIVEIASSQDTLGNAGGMCQAWVADVYERAGQSRISSCCASSAADKWMVSTEQNNIPLGAAVYGYSNPTVYCDCGRDAGHVGIYIGNGQVASNVGGIRIESLDSWIASFGWKGWGWNGGTDYSK